jgi:hypothetical protein
MATVELGGGIKNMALSRFAGKPFTVTEFNFTAPNRFRAEGGLLMGAIAARQDWDGLWRFAWSHSIEAIREPRPMDYFNAQTDPAMQASDRALVALFLRRDLEPAKEAGTLKLDPNVRPQEGYDAAMKAQILTRRLYSDIASGGDGEMPEPTGAQPVRVDADKGILTVESPRTCGIFAPVGEKAKAGALEATLSGARAALWISTLDGKPLASSRRMLLSHVTDIQNAETRFAGPDRDTLENWGRLPHLAHDGEAQVALKVESPERVQVFRLDMAGRRLEAVPTQTEGGAMRFSIRVRGKGGAALYYELARK